LRHGRANRSNFGKIRIRYSLSGTNDADSQTSAGINPAGLAKKCSAG
jgi:hypothetical protein